MPLPLRIARGKLERWSCCCVVWFDIDDPVHATGRRVRLRAIVVVVAVVTVSSASDKRHEKEAQFGIEIYQLVADIHV